MAGPVWGTAEIRITADGKILPAQVRRIAEKAGDTAGEGFNKRFNARLNRNRGFAGLFRNLGGVVRNLGRVFSGLGRAVFGSMDSLKSASSGLSESVSGLAQSFGTLGTNAKQWVAIIALVIAVLPPAVALIQALSGGIVLLIGSIVGAVAGIAVLVTAFVGLYAEGAKLTQGAKDAKSAFSDLGDTFSVLRDSITNAVFEGMADSIKALNDAVAELTPAISSFASFAGDQLSKIFDALASPESVQIFKDLLEGFKPIFASLTDGAIGFVEGFGNFLVAALPAIQQFAGWIADAGQAFASWTASTAGQQAIQAFLQKALDILPPLMDAVFELADAFAGLVSPAVVTDLSNLLSNLTEGLQWIFDIVQIIGGLDIFGNIIAAFQSISALLTPLTPGLTAIATAIGDVLYSALMAIIPLFEGLGAILGPIVTVAGELATTIGQMLTPFFEAIGAILTELAPVFTAIGELFGQIAQVVADALVPILGPLIDLFVETAVALVPLVKDLVPLLVTVVKASSVAIQALSPIIIFLANIIGEALSIAVKIVTGLLKAAVTIIGSVARALNSVLAPAVKAVERVVKEFGNFWKDVWRNAGNAMRDFGRGVDDVIGNVISWIRDAMNWVGRLVGAIGRLDFGAIGSLFGGGGGNGFASGGVLTGPRRILAGEAGPEAIVPLNRALSQVDPSVRWLSAIAQNKGGAMASGGIAGGGRTNVIESGAIVVQEASSALATGIEVLNRISNGLD